MVKDLKLEDKKELMAHLSKGIFTLRDMYEQFQTISQVQLGDGESESSEC